MTSIQPKTLKGFRDFLPTAARKRNQVIQTLKAVFEKHGFEPLETPALEYEEILGGKYGDEGEKLMYRFTDQGGRNVAMRYDQTVPLARVVAQYGSIGLPDGLPMPFKRYQIQNVWRAENTQKGRYREFFQADIDIVGTASPLADAETLAVIYKAYTALGFSHLSLLVNDRSIFGDLSTQAIIIIDKLKKIGEEQVITELQKIGVSKESFEAIKNAQPTKSLQTILDLAKSLGVPDTALQFDPTLARGLDYYTGIIIEAEVQEFDGGSIGGGGRYDNLVGMFSKESIPAVGFAFGFDRTVEAMEALNLFPKDLTTTQVLVTIFSEELTQQSLTIAESLRTKGVNTEIYLDSQAKMEKQLKYANKKKIPYIIIVGPDELAQGNVTIKNLITGEQKTEKQETITELFK